MADTRNRSSYPADRGQRYADIERAATYAREKIAPGLPLDRALAGLAFFENLDAYKVKIDDSPVPLDFGIGDLPEAVEALTYYEVGRARITLVLSESTYAALERDVSRARFTLFHEVGHAVMHSAELKRMATRPVDAVAMLRQENWPSYRDTEWQANAFASAMLMPAAGLELVERENGGLDIITIQERFKVSAFAAQIRLDTFTRRRSELVSRP